MGRASFVFRQRVERGAELLVEADVTLALVDREPHETGAHARRTRNRHSTSRMNVTQDLDIWTLIAQREHRREGGDAAAGRGVVHVVDVHLPEVVLDPPRGNARPTSSSASSGAATT